jgi:hypothetical protein
MVTNADSVSWHIQLNQTGIKLTSNQTYTVSFWAKSSHATNADASIMRAHTDWVNLGSYQTLNLTTNWQFFTNTFQALATETNARVNFGSMGNKPATFWFCRRPLPIRRPDRSPASGAPRWRAARCPTCATRAPVTPAPARPGVTGSFPAGPRVRLLRRHGGPSPHQPRLPGAGLRHHHGQQPGHRPKPARRH